MNDPIHATETNRRTFLRQSSALGAGLFTATEARGSARRGREDALRIGLVGCGGRGTGAAVQALST